MTQIPACIRCGECCRAAPCHTGKLVAFHSGIADNIEAITECAFLRERNGKTTCTIAHNYHDSLGIGSGCLFSRLRRTPEEANDPE